MSVQMVREAIDGSSRMPFLFKNSKVINISFILMKTSSHVSELLMLIGLPTFNRYSPMS